MCRAGSTKAHIWVEEEEGEEEGEDSFFQNKQDNCRVDVDQDDFKCALMCFLVWASLCSTVAHAQTLCYPPTPQTLFIRRTSFFSFPAFFTLNGTPDFLHLLSFRLSSTCPHPFAVPLMLRLRHSCAWFHLHSDFHQHPSSLPTCILSAFLRFQSGALPNSSLLYLSRCFRLNCPCPCLWTSGSCTLLPLDTLA